MCAKQRRHQRTLCSISTASTGMNAPSAKPTIARPASQAVPLHARLHHQCGPPWQAYSVEGSMNMALLIWHPMWHVVLHRLARIARHGVTPCATRKTLYMHMTLWTRGKARAPDALQCTLTYSPSPCSTGMACTSATQPRVHHPPGSRHPAPQTATAAAAAVAKALKTCRSASSRSQTSAAPPCWLPRGRWNGRACPTWTQRVRGRRRRPRRHRHRGAALPGGQSSR